MWLMAYPHISLIGARDHRYSNRHRRGHWTVCCKEGDPAESGSKTERRSSRKDRLCGDNFHTLSDGEESESETDLDSARPMTKLNMKP